MKVTDTRVIGSLVITIFILTGIVTLVMNDQVKMRIDNDKSTFYVKNDANRWIVSGREYNRLFDGNKAVYRDVSSIKVQTTTNDDNATIQRYTAYKRGPVIIDTYFFIGGTDDVELFPVYHTVEIYNATGLYYRYSVDELDDTGDKRKLDSTIYSFGNNMKVQLNPGYRWAWIGYPYGSDSISAQYDIPSDHVTLNFRLFDPPTAMTLAGFNRDISAELGGIYTALGSNSGGDVCFDISHPDYGVNFTCGTGATLSYDINITYFRRNTFNDSSIAKNNTDGGNFIVYQELGDEIEAGSSAIYYVNYTKKSSYVNPYIWQVKYGNLGVHNITIPNNCVNQSDNKLLLSMNMSSTLIGSPNCWNGTEWQVIGNLTNGLGSGSLDNLSDGSEMFDGDYDTFSCGTGNGDAWSTDCTGVYVYTRIYEEAMFFNDTGKVYIDVHQYDEVDNLTINITGVDTGSGLPTDVKVYVNNTLIITVPELGDTTSFNVSVFNDTTTNKVARFDGNELILIGYVDIPATANVTNTSITVKGEDYSSIYKTTYLDTCGNSTQSFTGNAIQRFRCDIDNLTITTINLSMNSTSNTVRLLNSANATIRTLSPANGTIENVITPALPCNTGDIFGLELVPTGAAQALTCSSDVFFEKFVLSGPPLVDTGNQLRTTISINDTPTNPWVQIGLLNGTLDFSYTGNLTTTYQTNGSEDKINLFLSTCTPNQQGDCSVPIYVFSETVGQITIADISINYTYSVNPVQIPVTIVEDFLTQSIGFTQLPIEVINTGSGIVTIDDVRYDYAGGNNTYEVLFHSADYTTNITHNVTYHYSRWNNTQPKDVDYVEFIPSSPYSKNVTPYGQLSVRPIFNITGLNYDETPFNFSVTLNETTTCINMSIWNNSNATMATLLYPAGEYELEQDKQYTESFGVWLFADYNCTSSSWSVWKPELNFTACCENCDVCN